MVTELPHVSLIMVTEPPMTHSLHPLDGCEVHPLTVSYRNRGRDENEPPHVPKTQTAPECTPSEVVSWSM